MKIRRRHLNKRKQMVGLENKPQRLAFKMTGLFLVILFIMGMVYGGLMAEDYQDKLEATKIIERILDHYSQPMIDSVGGLVRQFFQEFTYFFILWFLSLTIIGIILVVFALFFTGFLMGFTLRFFIGEYGSNGLTMGLLYTFPKNILLIPFSIYFTLRIIGDAVQLFSSIYIRRDKKAFQRHFKQSLQLLLFTVGIVLLHTLLNAITMKWVGERLNQLL